MAQAAGEAEVSAPDYWFYHLEASTVQSVLPDLMEKVLGRGWRALIKCRESDLGELDQFLWTYKNDSFLPHGRDDQPQADQQPILLSASATKADGADCIVLLDGAEVSDLSGVSRCIVMINGRSSEDIARERKRWKTLSDAGHTLSYFQQDERGAWQKKS
ncbi:DNA polymerase III subunit chi [Fretibacter rubidus]|uniref:DNA polymerase III subunit chi n=1 Tax=Fretibacter rubidus TaxID=570162 RepID=UPI00352B1372